MANPPLMPMANSRDAPRFSSDPSGFDSFFEDVEELATRASLSDADKIKWAIRYARTEGDSWKHVECLLDPANPPTYALFKTQVLQCYPHISATRRYTSGDLLQLVNQTRGYRDMTRDDFGDYYRRFLTYTNYLISKGRYTERERNVAYLRGLPQPFRSRILQRLSVKQVDVQPDDGYQFKDIHEAALFVFNSGSGGEALDEEPVVPKVEPKDQGSVGELIQAVSELARVFSANVNVSRPRSPRPSEPYPAPGGAIQNAPPRTQNQGCMFCSADGHYVRECTIASQYIQQKKVIRNEEGKLTLPDGNYLPHYIRGRNMRERIDNYWSGKEGPENPVETHFLESRDECVFTIDINPTKTYRSNYPMEDDAVFEAQRLQIEIDALREAQVLALEKAKKLQFDGVEIMKRNGPPKPGSPIPPPPARPNVYARPPTRQPTSPATVMPATPPDVTRKPRT